MFWLVLRYGLHQLDVWYPPAKSADIIQTAEFLILLGSAALVNAFFMDLEPKECIG